MSHYAEIVNGIVTRVIVAEQGFIDSGAVGDPSNWVQTSYNTFAGQHRGGGTPLRKNFAGVGYAYDAARDAFIPPRPYASWSLDEATCQWVPPVAMPQDGRAWAWNEDLLVWQVIPWPT